MKTYKTDLLDIRHQDCMEMMKEFPDDYFDLAIVDPPYFDGPQKKGYYKGTKQVCDVGDYKGLESSWEIPQKKYFDELIRISKNQIIWGINYFKTDLYGGAIVWIKGEQGSPFSMADIAYQSFYNRIDIFKYVWSGFWQEAGQERENRIHPTQKPVALYKWLLANYAKSGNKILDTHMGSGSHAITCHYAGLQLTACELDEDYFDASIKRIKKETSQIAFDFDKIQEKPQELTLL